MIFQGQEISHFDHVNIYDDTQNYGLEFRNKNDTNFIQLLVYVTEVSKKQALDNLPEVGKELLKDVKDNEDSFYKKISYNGSMNNYNKYPVLKYIRPNDFVEAVIKIEPHKRRSIVLAISSRYKNLGNMEIFLSEIAWLQETVFLLLDQAEQKRGKISSFQIKHFTNAYLMPAINSIHKASLNPKQANRYRWSPIQNQVGIPQTVAHMKKLGVIFNLEC